MALSSTIECGLSEANEADKTVEYVSKNHALSIADARRSLARIKLSEWP